MVRFGNFCGDNDDGRQADRQTDYFTLAHVHWVIIAIVNPVIVISSRILCNSFDCKFQTNSHFANLTYSSNPI